MKNIKSMKSIKINKEGESSIIPPKGDILHQLYWT